MVTAKTNVTPLAGAPDGFRETSKRDTLYVISYVYKTLSTPSILNVSTTLFFLVSTTLNVSTTLFFLLVLPAVKRPDITIH